MYSLFLDATLDYFCLAILKDKKLIDNKEIKIEKNLTDVLVEEI
jgi:tRNA A37 threonylcarbamoyladenosine modification protein TsaB